MADGITCAATTTFQNDAHADAALDGVAGSYSFADLSLKCPANFPDLGAVGQKVYRGVQNLQHGDGVGTLATSLIALNEALVFDTGKTLSYSTTGAANRLTRFGQLVQGASGKPSGKDGVQLICGAALTARGLLEIYGSYIRTTSGSLSLVPGVAGLGGEVINTLLQSAASLVIGVDVSGNLAEVYNLDCMSAAGSAAGAITNWGVDRAERVTVASNTANNFIRTGARVRVKDLVMIGQLQGVFPADLRNTGVSVWDLVNPTFSGNVDQHNHVSPVDEWFSFGVLVVNKLTGAIVAGIPISIYDAFGTLVLEGLSDADGQISFGTPGDITENTLRVRRAGAGINQITNYFPFTVVVNQGVYRSSSYLSYEYKMGWAGRALPSNRGIQYGPMLEVIYVQPVGPPTLFNECTVN